MVLYDAWERFSALHQNDNLEKIEKREEATRLANQPPPLHSIDRKDINSLRDQKAAAEAAIKNLKDAIELNKNSYALGNAVQKAEYMANRSGLFGKPNKKSSNTTHLVALMNNVVLAQLKATFGARPSDAELIELKKTLGLNAASIQEREDIMNNNIRMLEDKIKKVEQNQAIYEGRK